jgi:hypothetical protein
MKCVPQSIAAVMMMHRLDILSYQRLAMLSDTGLACTT